MSLERDKKNALKARDALRKFCMSSAQSIVLSDRDKKKLADLRSKLDAAVNKLPKDIRTEFMYNSRNAS